MPKDILFLSYRWNDERLQDHSSDRMMGLGFARDNWNVHYHDYRDATKENGPRFNQTQIFDKIMTIEPDLVFITKGEKIDPATITKAKKCGFKGKVIGWYNDIRKDSVRCVVNIMKVCDWFFHCVGGDPLMKYHKLTNTPCSFLFAPFEPDFMKPKPFDDRTYNVTHYGQLYKQNHFDPMRREIVPAVRDLLDDYGACFDKGFIRGEEYYAALGNSKMSISIPAVNHPYYFSNRHSHIMGSGSVVLSYAYKNVFDTFAEGVDIITFKNSEELRNKIKYYLNNRDELKFVQENSMRFANTFMTSDSVYNEILHVLRTGESSYPFAQVINPDKTKGLNA